MSKIAYVPDVRSVRAFNDALDQSVNAIRDMGIILLGELFTAKTLSEAKARHSAYVRAVKEDRKARMTEKVRKELFSRSEREVKALYKAGKLSAEARAEWSKYNMIGKRAGQIGRIRDAMFEYPVVREAVEQFLASKGKNPTFFALEELVRKLSAKNNANNGEAVEANKAEFTPEQFEVMLKNMLAGARKKGFETEALAIMARIIETSSVARNRKRNRK